MCLVQKSEEEERWSILIKYMFDSQGDKRDFKAKLHFYP